LNLSQSGVGSRYRSGAGWTLTGRYVLKSTGIWQSEHHPATAIIACDMPPTLSALARPNPVAPSAHRFTGLSLGANLTSPLARPDLRQHPSGTEPARKNSSVLRKKPLAVLAVGLQTTFIHRLQSIGLRLTFASPAQFSVAGLGSPPLPRPNVWASIADGKSGS
jgi:hypothetical protein